MKELQVRNENGELLISARDLHEALVLDAGREERFSQWFKRHLQYGFEENIDYFTGVKKFTVVNNGATRELEDYALKIDMAKEICMLQKSDKGRQYRKYFIEVEKRYKEGVSTNAYITEMDIAKAEISLTEATARLLNLNESSKLAIVTNIYENHGIPTNMLPIYADSLGVIKSATDLLRENEVNISARTFNKLLVERGILKECTRTNSKGKEKTFKMLADTQWGENKVHPKCPNQTQPMFYEGKFRELLKLLEV